MTKQQKNLIKIPVRAGDNISDLLNILVRHHEAGEYNYYLEIYGEKYYSSNINYDEAFTKLIGCTPEEYEQKLEEEELKNRLYKEQKALDAKTNLDYRILAGKKQIIEPKWSLWEETVRKYSEEPYYTSELDIIIKYLELLNKNISIEEISKLFIEQFPEVGDWYTSTLLSNIAKFHEKGILLFEHLRDNHKKSGHEVSDSSEYFKKLRNINTLLTLGESIETATTIASNKIANINICGMNHLVLVSDNKNMMGVNLDYMVIGEYINETTTIIYIIDGTKVNSFLTVNGETIDINIDGSFDGPYKGQVTFELKDADIQTIQKEYEVAYNTYTKLDIETLLKVLKSIRELTQESKESPEKLVLEEVFNKYKENIVTLKKSAK